MNNPNQAPFVPVARGRPYIASQGERYYCPRCQGEILESLPEDGRCRQCRTQIAEPHREINRQ